MVRDTPAKRVLTVAEVADQLGISRNHAYAMAREGKFPTIRLGHRLIVPADRFDSWLAGDE